MTNVHLHRHPDRRSMGAAAGAHAAQLLGEALQQQGHARLMLAAAPSQTETLATLAASGLDFSRVRCFHMDDYLGLAPAAPQGFGNWLQTHFLDLVPGQPPTLTRIDTTADAESAARAYAEQLGGEPFDLTLCGLGVNGHLAFNDPPADFTDPEPVRVVRLDRASRQQQVDEGHFESLDAVPASAVTVTIPRLLAAAHVICSVPGEAKRQAVHDTLTRDPDGRWPGTALRTHPDAHLYVDATALPEAAA